MKPFAEACEQNKAPILAVLRTELAKVTRVLEIGSGTGQHAVHFARQLPHLDWYASDVPAHHAGIALWLAEANLPNLHGPLSLDVRQPVWPLDGVDAVFSANTAHIMDWEAVEQMFAGIGRVLGEGGRFCLYGPFSYGGRHVSESNARFDAWLRARDPLSGVRDAHALHTLAGRHGLEPVQDYEMPVNNRILVWRRA